MMRPLLSSLIATLAMLSVLSDQASAQAIRKVRARVTTVTSSSVFIDQGRDAHIQAGDTLILYPLGQPKIEVSIRAVSRTSSRADVPNQSHKIASGHIADVVIPESRFTMTVQGEEKEDKKPIPAHPPWEHPIASDAQDKPLLAPAFRRPPDARPTEIRGRVYANLVNIWGDGNVDNFYMFFRSGTEMRISNPAKLGGELHFRGDFTQREAHLDDAPTDRDRYGRIERLSYSYGNEAAANWHMQAGRFLQPMFPELGVLDGLSVDFRTGELGRTGISVGGFPEPFPANGTGDNSQGAIFHRYVRDPEESLVLGIAYQKTWHHSEQDRDLLLTTFDLRPAQNVYLHSTVWVDYYGSGDTIKSDGFQLTEMQVHGTYIFEQDHGIGASYSLVRWPELKRNEYRFVSANEIRNNRTARVNGRAWYQLTEDTRLDGRVTLWEDQTRDGGNGDAGITFRDLFYEHGRVGFEVFHNTGTQVAGSGLRITASRFFDAAFVDFRYEWARYDNELIGSGGTHATLHAFTGNAHMTLGRSTDLTFSADYRTGGGQDSTTISIYLQKRF